MPPREIVRPVVDTNTVVSGTIAQAGHGARIVNAWIEGQVLPIRAQDLLVELRRVVLAE